MELRWNGNCEQKIEALWKTPVSLPSAAVQIEHSLPRIKTGTHLCGTGQEPTTFISANNLFSKHIHDRCSFELVLCIKVI